MFTRIPRTGSHLRIAARRRRPQQAHRQPLARHRPPGCRRPQQAQLQPLARHRLAHLYPPAKLPRVPEVMTMNQGLTALGHRDQALAELDRGDAGRARAIASQALVLLETGGQGESSDAAALLVALAETDECLGRFDLARAAAGRCRGNSRSPRSGGSRCLLAVVPG